MPQRQPADHGNEQRCRPEEIDCQTEAKYPRQWPDEGEPGATLGRGNRAEGDTSEHQREALRRHPVDPLEHELEPAM